MESLDDVINVSLVTDYDTETNVKMELKSGKDYLFLKAIILT